MRVAIVVTTIMIVAIYSVDAKINFGKVYVRNINKSVERNCNIHSYQKTKNIDLYNCFAVNSTNKCKHLSQFDEYNKNMLICIEEYNSSLGFGVLISVFGCLILSLCCMEHR